MSNNSNDNDSKEKVPTRPFGLQFGSGDNRLSESVPIIGLGCSSFSHFFWSPDELADRRTDWTPERLDKNHPFVQDWIKTIRYAVECGMVLLDTAPWYGHGTSEIVIGWAMEDMQASSVDRASLVINTKIGRYEETPSKQFDFTYKKTLASVQRSLERMKCSYIDVLQLHDPEFAPTLDLLLNETVPAMVECRNKGYCKSLGMTGYPLRTQYQIISRALELSNKGGAVWDQSLTYGHYNMFDTSLFDQPIEQCSSFADFCSSNKIGLMAAAPLCMGLLQNKNKVADWHPAPNELVSACKQAALVCEEEGVDIATLAILFALANPRISCTVLGMKSVAEVKFSHALANRLHGLAPGMTQEEILKKVLTDDEHSAFVKLRDPKQGPFATIWESEKYNKWDGVLEANKFWRTNFGEEQTDWHLK